MAVPVPSVKSPSAATLKSPLLDNAILPFSGFTRKYPSPPSATSNGAPVGFLGPCELSNPLAS